MRSINYYCPDCGISTESMELYDVHPVTKLQYNPTAAEMERIIEWMTDTFCFEKHADLFATKYFECLVCGKLYNRFQLKRVVSSGSVESYIEQRNSNPFSNKDEVK